MKMKQSLQLTRARLSADAELEKGTNCSSSSALCECIPRSDNRAASLSFAVIVASRRPKMRLDDTSSSAEQPENKRTKIRRNMDATLLLQEQLERRCCFMMKKMLCRPTSSLSRSTLIYSEVHTIVIPFCQLCIRNDVRSRGKMFDF